MFSSGIEKTSALEWVNLKDVMIIYGSSRSQYSQESTVLEQLFNTSNFIKKSF